MVKPHDLIAWFSDIEAEDTRYVGKKGAHIGELRHAKFPIPEGFVITSYAFHTFLKENQLNSKIKSLLSTINYHDPDSVNQVASHIRRIIMHGVISHELAHTIARAYKHLGGVLKEANVNISSSEIRDEARIVPFASYFQDFVDVHGEANVLETVKKAWAGVFTSSILQYRHTHRIDPFTNGVALVVQKRVEPDVSGIFSTIDVLNNDKKTILIEAVWGHDEYRKKGKIKADRYEVTKDTYAICSTVVNDQITQLKKVQSERREVKVPLNQQKKQKLTDHEIIALAKLGYELEKHFYFPQEVEWVKEGNHFYILRTRPASAPLHQLAAHGGKELLARGEPVIPGIASGPIRIIKTQSNLYSLRLGDVLVTSMTDASYTRAMRKAAAIITEKRGKTSHVATFSREAGVPVLMGVDGATRIFRDGMVVSVDSSAAAVYKGNMIAKASRTVAKTSHDLKTQTKVYVNMTTPHHAQQISSHAIDGVGELAAEGIIKQFGIHPKKIVKEHKQKHFVDYVSQHIAHIAKSFYPRPVFYRISECTTREYQALKGGMEFEPQEGNPLLGYRGAFRHIHDQEVLKLELEAIKKVRQQKLTNVHVLIPFVRTVDELRLLKKGIYEAGLRRSSSFNLGMMIETPSNVLLLDKYIDEGIDGVSIHSDTLTSLLLGFDRHNEHIAPEFNERDRAVLWAFENIIRTCTKRGVASSITGQLPSLYPDIVRRLVEWGIDSISVTPDAFDFTKRLIFEHEKNL